MTCRLPARWALHPLLIPTRTPAEETEMHHPDPHADGKLRSALIEAAERLDLPLTVRQVDALAVLVARKLGGPPVPAPAPVVTPTFSEAGS